MNLIAKLFNHIFNLIIDKHCKSISHQSSTNDLTNKKAAIQSHHLPGNFIHDHVYIVQQPPEHRIQTL